MNNKKRAWLYCQVGKSKNTDIELLLEKDMLKAFANRKGCTVVGMSEDFGGRRSRSRSGLMQMLDAAHHNCFDVLLVMDYKSIYHDIAQMTTYLCQLQALGLDICSVSMGSVKNYDDFCVDADTADSSEG